MVFDEELDLVLSFGNQNVNCIQPMLREVPKKLQLAPLPSVYQVSQCFTCLLAEHGILKIVFM